MKYLAIDTSGKNLTVVLCIDGEIHKYFDKECGVNHSVALMPKVQEIVEQANFNLADVDFFVAVTGAGSFTGIRIGVSTIKALCFAYKKPCLNITSFDTLAYNEPCGKTLAVIDAKHGGYYVCGYDNGKVDFAPSYILTEQLQQLQNDYTLVADSEIKGINVQTVSVLDGLIKAIEDKKDLVTHDLESLVPLYVRKSQAEEGR